MSAYDVFHNIVKRVKVFADAIYKLCGLPLYAALTAPGSVSYDVFHVIHERAFVAYVLLWVILIIIDRRKL